MKDDIPALVELSLADLTCSRLHERTAAIPRELEKHQAELVLLQGALDEQERHRADLQRERRLLEKDADAAKARRRELELQQFRIKNNIEYQALTREIDEMRRRASEVEDQALALITEEETVQADLNRLKEQVAQEERKVSGVRERLERELGDYTRQLEQARTSRDQLIARLDPALRTRYERIRRSKGDMAVVGVEHGACGGCGYQLPPQKIVEVQKGDRVLMCEGCGRLLVWIGK